MKRTTDIFLAPVAFDSAGGTPPGSFTVIRYGKTTYTKGDRDGRIDFNEADADRVLASFASRTREVVIDFDHATVSGGNAPAAGWVDAFEKTQDGLAARVRWTPMGVEALEGLLYRYHSPVIRFDAEGRVCAILSVALTNHPAFHGYAPLAADDTKHKEQNMNETLTKLLGALGVTATFADDGAVQTECLQQAADAAAKLADDATRASEFLKELGCESFDDAREHLKSLVSAEEKAKLEARIADIEAEKAVEAAFADGKLAEAQREWATAYARKDPAAFADFVKSAPKAAPGPASGVKPAPPKTDAPKHAFTSEARSILKKCGLDDKAIAELEQQNKE